MHRQKTNKHIDGIKRLKYCPNCKGRMDVPRNKKAKACKC